MADDMRIVQEVSSPTDRRRRRMKMKADGGAKWIELAVSREKEELGE